MIIELIKKMKWAGFPMTFGIMVTSPLFGNYEY